MTTLASAALARPAKDTWRDARRSRMLEAAGRVFALRPFAQVSMDEIAQEAGVGKPTLYRYFTGKDALFQAVFVEALDDLEARLEEVAAAGGGVARLLPAMVGEIAPTFRDHLVSLRLLGDESLSADISKRRIFRDRRVRIARRLAACLEAGVARGELRPCNAEAIAEMVIGMIWSAAATSRADDAGIAAEVTDLVLYGLAAPHSGMPRALAGDDLNNPNGRVRPQAAAPCGAATPMTGDA